MPAANPDKEVCDKAFSQLYEFFMEGKLWTPAEDMPAYYAWHEGVPNAEWLPDFWDDTAEPDFLLWLLGGVWNRGWLLRPWPAWYGLERFIDECLAAAERDLESLWLYGTCGHTSLADCAQRPDLRMLPNVQNAVPGPLRRRYREREQNAGRTRSSRGFPPEAVRNSMGQYLTY